MNFDTLLSRYFGVTDIATIAPEALAAGTERMRVDLGLQTDRGQRFALWSMLHLLGAAPDLDVIFEHADDREAARNFMDLMASAQE